MIYHVKDTIKIFQYVNTLRGYKKSKNKVLMNYSKIKKEFFFKIHY